MAKIARAEELRIKRLQKDTYSARVKEGRTRHSSTSITVLILGSLSFILQLGAVLMPYWHTDFVGAYGYGASRSWGLFQVSGKLKKGWHEIMTDTCRYWGRLNLFASCSSPICIWYQVKCKTYYEMSMLGYGVGFLFIVELFIHVICLAFTWKLTPRTLAWACIWWWAVIIIHISCFLLYFCISQELFGNLEALSFYPSPSFGVSSVFSGLALFMLMWVTFLGYQLSIMWPRVDLDSSDSESGSESETSHEGRVRRREIRRRRGKKGADDSSSTDGDVVAAPGSQPALSAKKF